MYADIIYNVSPVTFALIGVFIYLLRHRNNLQNAESYDIDDRLLAGDICRPLLQDELPNENTVADDPELSPPRPDPDLDSSLDGIQICEHYTDSKFKGPSTTDKCKPDA